MQPNKTKFLYRGINAGNEGSAMAECMDDAVLKYVELHRHYRGPATVQKLEMLRGPTWDVKIFVDMVRNAKFADDYSNLYNELLAHDASNMPIKISLYLVQFQWFTEVVEVMECHDWND